MRNMIYDTRMMHRMLMEVDEDNGGDDYNGRRLMTRNVAAYF